MVQFLSVLFLITILGQTVVLYIYFSTFQGSLHKTKQEVIFPLLRLVTKAEFDFHRQGYTEKLQDPLELGEPPVAVETTMR